MRKLFTLFTGLLVVSTLWADAVYEPLIVADGFNRDVIAETSPYTKSSVSYYQPYSTNPKAAYYTTHNHATKEVIRLTNDAESRGLTDAQKEYLATETGWPNDYGNPGDRIVNCLTDRYPDLYWELAPYTAENALCLRDSTLGCVNSGRLTFKNIGCYQKLCFLTFAGGAPKDDTPASAQKRQLKATVYYSTGEPDMHPFEFLDCAGVKAERQAHRCQIYSSGFVKGLDNNTVYAAVSEMNVDTHRLIDSVHFSYNGSASTGIAIFAVTGKTADIAAPEMKEDAEATTELVDNSFNIHWNAVDGATSYRVDVATDEDFHHMVDGYNNETVTGTDTIISNIGSGTEYYWRVRAVDSEGGQGKSSAPKRVKTSGSPATREDANSIEAEMAALKTEGTETDLTILRTLYKDGYFNTLCLPFDLASLDGTPLAGGELFEFVSATAEGENLLEINIAPVEGNVVEAGKPYLIRWANTGEVMTELVFHGVTVTASEGQSVGVGVQFVGHIGMEQIEYENHYNLFLGGNNQLYWPINDGTIMKGFRAYFAIPTGGSTPAPVRRGTPARLTIRSNVPTSVSSIQEQSNIPAKIIENGQLVIIKNGVRYNTTGQQIH